MYYYLVQLYPLVVASACSLCVGGVVCIVVSLVLSIGTEETRPDEAWEVTRNIDNPLCPWTEVYARYE